MSDSRDLKLLNRLRDNAQLFEDIRSESGSELARQERLRATYEADLVVAGVSLEDCRSRAASRLPDGDRLWLTAKSLQQATAWEVALHKAARFPEGERVTDLCSGVGVDTAALLNRGPVTSVDIDEAMLLRAKWNLEAWRNASRVSSGHEWTPEQGDVCQLGPAELAGMGLLHVDPDRRVNRDRAAKRLEQYSPKLEWMQEAVTSGASGALKLGPASNFQQKFPGTEIELISLHGECREATVWFGDLAGPHSFRATSLPTGETVSGDPLQAWCPIVDGPQEYIFDPDPAIVRSGLLDTIGEMHSMGRLDGGDEYLTSGGLPETAFLTSYFVEATLPNNMRKVKNHLRDDPCRDYEIKCRHVKVDATKVRRSLPVGKGPLKTLFFLRVNGRARVILARRVTRGD
ncbi:MAG TPA: hypothetical protein DCG12_13000 [Planctomycetaceae bacterium]|nr:hypothetical protein [Planctomycetaceae bacterium]